MMFLPAHRYEGAVLAPASEHNARVIARTNLYRVQNGCPPLQMNARLMKSAQGHSDEMAQKDYFSHDSADGSPFDQRFTAVGYEFLGIAENLAAQDIGLTDLEIAEIRGLDAGHRLVNGDWCPVWDQ